ncbi:alpha/beta hydrolase [Litorivita sp. NS0012-18]|uniref:alpha/beta hydrolase n=1 Tax=Litorivita sp. NS0012-18 TaxID=3127655 RepID=UPI003105AC27
MAKITYSGPVRFRIESSVALGAIAVASYARHALGRKMEPSWSAQFETGIRFWRRQFTRAMRMRDMARGRLLFDALQTSTDDVYEVTAEACAAPRGHWYVPRRAASKAVILYLHGGGYTFHGAVSARFAQMLAHHTGARVFAPDYRLTPEHPHPAQSDDALAAWRYLRERAQAQQIVVVGDSAGGHMALMLLQRLKSEALEQPALCIGLCPWTDIGPRGASLRCNDRYDLVQGWMALQFGRWLDPDARFGRAALSPVSYDFAGLAPIYLQAGGREVLRDMIIDFAQGQAVKGAEVMLDLWPDMPHDFQAYDSLKPSSTEALARLVAAVAAYTGQGAPLAAMAQRTVVASDGQAAKAKGAPKATVAPEGKGKPEASRGA